MIEELEAYYRSQGIHPEDFHCKHRSSCAAACATFTEARASLIGWQYDGLVFLSLDPGQGWPAVEDRTFQAVQDRERVSTKWRIHWRETHRIAEALLQAPSRGRFAHANAAKCTQNKPKNAQADDHLFENCREYLRGELAILKPRILVTQGKLAHRAFEPIANARRLDRFRSVTDEGVFWIRIHHPSSGKHYWAQKREHLETWVSWVAAK
jgi:hypothetical protein